MDITLRLLPVRDSDHLFVVAASSMDGTYSQPTRNMSLEGVLRLLDGLQLAPEYLSECRAHVEAVRGGIVLTTSGALEEALASA